MTNTTHYLSINEFSQFIDAPKERLRFYDNEGLFSPAKRGDNGYRYYTHDQAYHFFLVTMLARFNYYSLNEIYEMFQQKNLNVQEIYEKQQPLLAKQYNTLQQSIRNTEYSIYYQNYIKSFELETPHLTMFSYPKHIITYLEYEDRLFSKVALDALYKHNEITQNIPDSIAIPFSLVLSKEAFYSPQFHISGFYAISNQQLDENCINNRPESKRLSLFYHYYGNIREIHSRMVYLNDYMNEHKLAMTDELYITISTTNASQIKEHLCYIRIAIPVEQIGNDFVPMKKELLPTKKRPNLLFTSGKFAKLCNISKETLRFYNQTGIISPYEIKDNNYKYYNVEQVSYMYAFKMLQRAGCTISEIKNYLIDNKISETELFELGMKHHQKKSKRLLHYLKMTGAILDIRDYLSDFTNPKEPFELDFFVIPHRYSEMQASVAIHSMEAMKNLETHIRTFFSPERLIFFPLAINMNAAEFENGSFLIKSHSSFDFPSYEDITTLPKQKYLFFSKEIRYKEVTGTLAYLQKFVNAKQYSVTGDIQIIITVNNLYKTAQNLYLFYFFIPIA